MTKHSPTFSAVLFNYNQSRYLPESLDAVANQSVQPEEIIIIDDASTDHSVDIIQDFIKDRPEIKLIQNTPNQGIIATQNLAAQVATGDFLFYVASDDRYSHDIIKHCKEVVAAHPDVGMISGNAATHCDAGHLQDFTLPFAQEVAVYTPHDLEHMARQRCMTFFGGANIMRRHLMQQLGCYNPRLKWHCDWFLYLLMAHSQPFAVVPETFVSIRRAEGQYSEACHDWQQQAPVTKECLDLLKTSYADHYDFFKRSAILPTNNPRGLWLLLRDKEHRNYITPLLVWRLLTYHLFRCAGTLVPTGLRSLLRRALRV